MTNFRVLLDDGQHLASSVETQHGTFDGLVRETMLGAAAIATEELAQQSGAHSVQFEVEDSTTGELRVCRVTVSAEVLLCREARE